MKRRLCKKKRLGEFREDCFEVEFSIDPPHSAAEDDAFWDAFIVGLIEAHGLQFGGGGSPGHWRGIVELDSLGPVAAERRQAVIEWLANQPRVTELKPGPLRDADHGWGD